MSSGRQWRASRNSRHPEHLARLAATLRRLHALPAPDHGRFNLLRGVGGLRQAHRVTSRGELANYVDIAATAWRISGAEDRPLAILHHDLHASNIIDGSQGLMLIDWECAAVADPLLDIACILSYHEAARDHASIVAAAIGLDGVTSRQLAAAVWLFDLHTYLWYRERRLRLMARRDAELEAERRLLSLPRLGAYRPRRLAPRASNRHYGMLAAVRPKPTTIRGKFMALLRVVDRDGVEHEVDARTGLKVMETLRELDYGVAAICGGMCSCATCHVYVDPEWQSRAARPPCRMSVSCCRSSPITRKFPPVVPDRIHPDLAGLRVTIAPDE